MAAQRPVQLTIRTNQQERDVLKQVAQMRGVTVAELVREALKKDGVPLPDLQPQ